MKRSGIADLPLHGGRVPAWLAERMTTLGTAIIESVLVHYGPSELLSRLSDPFWFQALGSVMGMDWHSSGITTSVVGALKRGLNPRASQLGIYVCGGRGRHSRRTPDELRSFADRTSLVRGRFGGRHKSICFARSVRFWSVFFSSSSVSSSNETCSIHQAPLQTHARFRRQRFRSVPPAEQ